MPLGPLKYFWGLFAIFPAVSPSQNAPRVFIGSWDSSRGLQANFLRTKSGPIALMLEEKRGAPLTVGLQLVEEGRTRGRVISLAKALQPFQANQSSLSTVGNFEVRLARTVFGVGRRMNCPGRLQLSIKKDSDACDRPSVAVGSFESGACGIQIRFSARGEPAQPFAAVFALFACLLTILGLLPILRAEPTRALKTFSESATLCSALVDSLLLFGNFQVSLHFPHKHFEPLSTVSLLLSLSFLLKTRFHLSLVDQRLNAQNISSNALVRAKSIAIGRFLAFSVICFLLSNVLLIRPILWSVVFAYPILQVMHNARNVPRRRCFSAANHFPFYIAQSFQPIIFRAIIGHSIAAATLICPILSAVCVALMFAQRRFGDAFLFSRTLCPNRLNVFDWMDSGDDAMCPICFGSLAAPPDVGDAFSKALIAARAVRTPCAHLFHADCLETWTEHSSICPCCRALLPPY